MDTVIVHIGNRVHTGKQCPRCKTAHTLERVHRPYWVKTLLFFLPLKRYACYRCKRKFYLLG